MSSSEWTRTAALDLSAAWRAVAIARAAVAVAIASAAAESTKHCSNHDNMEQLHAVTVSVTAGETGEKYNVLLKPSQ